MMRRIDKVSLIIAENSKCLARKCTNVFKAFMIEKITNLISAI